MKSRWLDQLLWLESRAVKSRNRHYTLRLLTIIGGVIVPALVSVNSANVGNRRFIEIFGWTAFGISQVVAISAAVEEFFHYGETYRRYRNTAEAMKIEGWQFFQLSGPYKGVQSHTDAYPTFATNVENIIQQDVEGYISQAAQADEQSKSRLQTLEQNLAFTNIQLQEQLRKPPAPIAAESSHFSTVQSYQQSSQQVVYVDPPPTKVRGILRGCSATGFSRELLPNG